MKLRCSLVCCRAASGRRGVGVGLIRGAGIGLVFGIKDAAKFAIASCVVRQRDFLKHGGTQMYRQSLRNAKIEPRTYAWDAQRN